MSRSNFPGDNSRDIAAHQEENRREIQKLLLQALMQSKNKDNEALERTLLLIMKENLEAAEIERLLKEATLDNGNVQKVLGMIDRKHLKALNGNGNGNGGGYR